MARLLGELGGDEVVFGDVLALLPSLRRVVL
jgi:hypothetical protein